MSLTFGSLCSGIEAASEAWLPLGWTCAYVAEIEPFPCHYLHQMHGASRPKYMPHAEDAEKIEDQRARKTAIRKNNELPTTGKIPNFGDVSQIKAEELPQVDMIAAGFPCQDFSIAGLRNSLAGSRGTLSISGVRLILDAARLGLVRGAVLEQVPDVLNTKDNAWGNILAGLVGADDPLQGLDHGGRWPSEGLAEGPRSRVAWGILDAQHFNLAQRRERVWAVVDFGDGPDPAAVLFERKSVLGNPAKGRQARERTAPTLSARTRGGGGLGTDFDLDGGLVADGSQRRAAADVAPTLTATYPEQAGQDLDGGALVAHALRAEGFDASEDGTGRGTPIVPVALAFSCKDTGADAGDLAPTMRAMGHTSSHANAGGQIAVAFNGRQDPISSPDYVGPLDTDGGTRALAFSLRGRDGGAMPEVEGEDVVPALRSADGGSTRPFVAFQGRGSNLDVDQEVAGTLGSNTDRASGGAPMVAFDETQITSKANRSNPKPGDPCHPLPAQGRPPTLASDYAVRRITVVEAERLQGFPDNRTLIHWPSANRKGEDLAETIAYLIGHGYSPDEAAELAQTPDGPRYRALGNSWPVNVARWLGERIAEHMPERRA